MKTANKESNLFSLVFHYIPPSFIILGLFIALILLLSGCNKSRTQVLNIFQEKPKVSKTNMSNTVQCMGNALNQSETDTAFVFVVKDITDGTIKDSAYQNGPLADAGRMQLLNTLSSHTHSHLGLVVDNFPSMFKQLTEEKVGLDRFGLASQKNMHTFAMIYKNVIDVARQQKNLSASKGIVPLVISGSFTRFDGDNILQEGSGHNAGRREGIVDALKKTITGQVDYGDTSSSRAITLVVNLTDPRKNLVVASQSFDLVFYRENKTFRLRIAYGEGFYGLSKNIIKVEGVHGAQQTLLDAAAFWILNRAYAESTDFSACFDSDDQQLLAKNEQISAMKAEQKQESSSFDEKSYDYENNEKNRNKNMLTDSEFKNKAKKVSENTEE